MQNGIEDTRRGSNMPDSYDSLEIDEATGLRYFWFKGQKRYRCPTLWESGAHCERDHYDPEYIRHHAREPHTADGNAKPVKIVQQSALVDHRGDPIRYEVPAELQNIRFKK